MKLITAGLLSRGSDVEAQSPSVREAGMRSPIRQCGPDLPSPSTISIGCG